MLLLFAQGILRKVTDSDVMNEEFCDKIMNLGRKEFHHETIILFSTSSTEQYIPIYVQYEEECTQAVPTNLVTHILQCGTNSIYVQTC